MDREGHEVSGVPFVGTPQNAVRGVSTSPKRVEEITFRRYAQPRAGAPRTPVDLRGDGRHGGEPRARRGGDANLDG
ncbi:hypothetical protein GCM10009642_29990 [Nocardiopsis metallicus]